MRFTSAALVAGFLATSTAFLLPPNIDEVKQEFRDARFKGAPKHFKDLIHSLLEEQITVVDLECPGCPFASAHSEEQGISRTIWQENVRNIIHLEFDTHDDGLNINGYPLLPVERFTSAPSPLMAHQVKIESAEKSVNVELSFVAEFLSPVTSSHDGEATLIPVEVTILKMNKIPVKINTIALKVIKTPQDSYIIVQTEQIPFKITPGAQACEGARSWAMCRVRAIIADQVRKLIEATKAKANQVHGWVKDKISGCGKHHKSSGHPHDTHARPHSTQHHGHHRHHHRVSRLSHMVHQTLRFFVIPALLGVIGGLTASAIGMLVGQAIVYLWVGAYRRGQRGPLRVHEEREIATTEEQDRLLKSAEAPPQYEDISSYRETLSRNVEAEAVGHENEKQ